ncbi:MAG: hypothetical protein WBP00_16590 [Saprospiraceae bacterium]
MIKNTIIIFFVLSLTGLHYLNAQIGQFEKSEDIGNPKIKGSAGYDPTTQTYTLKGGGSNIWFNHDEFHFLYKKIKGDFLLTAHFQLIGNDGGNGHRKTGWMIRESTDHDAVSVNTCLHGDGLVVIQWRPLRGAYMRDPEEEIFFAKQYFGENIIQLERIGKKITMRIAHPGEAFEEMGTVDLPTLKDEVLIGPYALAHDPDGMQEARVWNVRVSTPIAPDWNPNHYVQTVNYDSVRIGSRLEMLDVNTGNTKIMYETSEAITSAAFSKDGKSLQYMENGKSFRIPAVGGSPASLSNASILPVTESDGQFIYYNDAKSGTNQIWRKKPDGSGAHQLTYDANHAWYPHLSPDKKSIVYLAYPHDVNPKMPVAYQRVALKLLPLTGGGPRTIAYFFGGKGSFEVNGWSPDGSKITFVSNGIRTQ